MKKRILSVFTIGLVLAGISIVIYGIATDCPGTAGVYVYCDPNT